MPFIRHQHYLLYDKLFTFDTSPEFYIEIVPSLKSARRRSTPYSCYHTYVTQVFSEKQVGGCVPLIHRYINILRRVPFLKQIRASLHD